MLLGEVLPFSLRTPPIHSANVLSPLPSLQGRALPTQLPTSLSILPCLSPLCQRLGSARLAAGLLGKAHCGAQSPSCPCPTHPPPRARSASLTPTSPLQMLREPTPPTPFRVQDGVQSPWQGHGPSTSRPLQPQGSELCMYPTPSLPIPASQLSPLLWASLCSPKKICPSPHCWVPMNVTLFGQRSLRT